MLKCDFCGKEFDSVRRIAIDSDYDRLSVRHEKRYACKECSDKKECERVSKEASNGTAEV